MRKGQLPALLKEFERRWSLNLESHFTPVSYNRAFPGRRITDGIPIVLKVGVPNSELWSEIEALHAFDGHGIVRLIDVDRDAGVLLLEYAQPGTRLSSIVDDVQSVSIAVRIMRQLWATAIPAGQFPTLAHWFLAFDRLRSRFDGKTGPLPEELVERAEGYVAELIDASTPVLLHGDLHHDNIVAAERQPWLAIDPKGVFGDPAYETATWMHNISAQFIQQRSVSEVQQRRVAQFAEELALDSERIGAWGFAHCILSACWSLEDGEKGWDWQIFCARSLLTHL
jgi:streptomycin 6-kinase